MDICEAFHQSGSYYVALGNIFDSRQSCTGHIDGTFPQSESFGVASYDPIEVKNICTDCIDEAFPQCAS